MGIQHLTIVNVVLSLSALLNMAAINDLECSVEKIINCWEFVMEVKV
jgi:hypothetical protein